MEKRDWNENLYLSVLKDILFDFIWLYISLLLFLRLLELIFVYTHFSSLYQLLHILTGCLIFSLSCLINVIYWFVLFTQLTCQYRILVHRKHSLISMRRQHILLKAFMEWAFYDDVTPDGISDETKFITWRFLNDSIISEQK